jgi:Reverse transcriptase (RNA-dependent DNA polymerase)
LLLFQVCMSWLHSDTVDHGVPVRRLENEFGISGLCSQWVWSHLTGRTNAVHVGNSTSAVATVLFRVPQGSVFGPILYTVVSLKVLESIFHQFVDDTRLYTKLSIPSFNALDLLHQCTNALQHWFWQNGLLLTPDKSIIEYFDTRNVLNEQISIARSRVGQVDCSWRHTRQQAIN